MKRNFMADVGARHDSAREIGGEKTAVDPVEKIKRGGDKGWSRVFRSTSARRGRGRARSVRCKQTKLATNA